MAITLQDVITHLLDPVPPVPHTVDTLKCGNRNTEVRGMVTTFMATYSVIQRAIEKGANLIITHEPTFYNHADKTEMLQNDPVYEAKLKLIEDSGMAIFRFHDYQHRYKPDMIVQGLIEELGWERYSKGENVFIPKPSPFVIPSMTVKEVSDHVKEKLNVPMVRLVGDLTMPCTRVGILPGYGGSGNMAIPFYQEENLDLIIAGEGPEWETPEYVRDANAQGKKRALMIIGHLKSEESGMKYLSKHLQMTFPNIPVHYMKEEQPFQFI